MTLPAEVSIIIPTLRERESLERVLPRLFAVLETAGINAEVLIVDDNSQDGTEALCDNFAKKYPVRLIVRTTERGLSTAVLTGFREAAGDICVVMDADGSHPPEAVPQLVEAVRYPFCDVAIGSRYTRGGSADENWGWFRRLNSTFATILARGLTPARDPLAGFFAVHRATVLTHVDSLQPLGYKILLELIVRCDCRRITEVPIRFRNRAVGTSKLSFKQQWLYLKHLARLYAARYLPTRTEPTTLVLQQPAHEMPLRKSA